MYSVHVELLEGLSGTKPAMPDVASTVVTIRTHRRDVIVTLSQARWFHLSQSVPENAPIKSTCFPPAARSH